MLIVDVDSHHYEHEHLEEILPFMENEFVKQLADVSKATGAMAFVIHDSGEIRSVFEKVSEDLSHGYLLTFQPEAAENHEWRSIEVVLPGNKGHKIRARDGYYPE